MLLDPRKHPACYGEKQHLDWYTMDNAGSSGIYREDEGKEPLLRSGALNMEQAHRLDVVLVGLLPSSTGLLRIPWSAYSQ